MAEQTVIPTPSYVPYSDQEYEIVSKKLDVVGDEAKSAVQTLIAWLERGECNKRTATNFYLAIQKTNTYVQELVKEKSKAEDHLHKVRMNVKEKMLGITDQLADILKVLITAELQKVRDHFTKYQRKSLDALKKEILDLKNTFSDELIDERIEDEMEMSDEDKNSDSDHEDKNLNDLREEVVSLRNQLSGVQQEVKNVRKESDETVETNQQNLQIICQKILENEKQLDNYKKLLECEAGIGNKQSQCENHSDVNRLTGSTRLSNGTLAITESEARFIGLIAAFLNAHPFGASIDYISSYLGQYKDRHQFNDTFAGGQLSVNTRDVESLMKQFPNVFGEEITGIGAALEKKWVFLGFKS